MPRLPRNYAVTTSTSARGVNVHKVQVPDPARPGKYVTFRWTGDPAPARRFAALAARDLAETIADERARRDADDARKGRPDMPTLSTYARGWIERKRAEADAGHLKFSPTTYARNMSMIEHWLDTHRLGRTPLDEITEALTREWSRWLAGSEHAGRGSGQLSTHTRELYVRNVRGYLRQARAEGLVHADPFSWFHGLKETPTTATRDRVKHLGTTLTADEFERAMFHARTPEDRALFRLMFHSGLRIGEALALRLGNVELKDDERAVLHIEKSWNAKTKELGPVKSEKSFRDVPMSRPVVDEALSLVKGDDPETFLFNRARDYTAQLNAAVAAAGVPRISGTHGLRRSHGTEMRRAGMMPEALRDRLGHDDIRTTLEYYVHTNDTDQWAYVLKGA